LLFECGKTGITARHDAQYGSDKKPSVENTHARTS
jgi:hypothetical protein